jgi:hypothetical protein
MFASHGQKKIKSMHNISFIRIYFRPKLTSNILNWKKILCMQNSLEHKITTVGILWCWGSNSELCASQALHH